MTDIIFLLAVISSIAVPATSKETGKCIREDLNCVHSAPECKTTRSEPIPKSKTIDGKACEGGCRFSDGYYPWCWVNQTAGQWAYCYSFCMGCSDGSETCGFNYRRNCRQLDGFFGRKNTTRTGAPCVNWKSTELADKFGDTNICQSTFAYAAWCYTDHPTGPHHFFWDYCFEDCPRCVPENELCADRNMTHCIDWSAYAGNKSTTSFKRPCAPWSSRDDLLHFGRGNLCRSSRGYAPWCYLTNGQWGYCFSDCATVLIGNPAHEQPTDVLRVMQFNTWHTGSQVHDGASKVAKHIQYVNPDIVALEEATNSANFERIGSLLSTNWTSVRPEVQSLASFHRHRHYANSVALRDPDLSDLSLSLHVPITGNGSRWINIHFWVVHLDYTKYGPYKACSGLPNATILNSEGGRTAQIWLLLQDPVFQKALRNSDEEPVIVLGDFNCPCALDWVPADKQLHCGRTFAWPATKLLLDAGLKDAYRELHPDPLENPGDTWSPLYPKSWYGDDALEPQDRIDLIFYKGEKLSPIKAEVYAGNLPIHTANPKENYQSNDWPSDHRSVFVDFKIDTD